MFNVYSHKPYSTICFTVGGSVEVELKDKLTKIETAGQQVQGEETVYQQGEHVHFYGAATCPVQNS